MSGTLGYEDQGLHLESDEAETLGLDPWTKRGWAGEDLAAWARALRAEVEARRAETERTFLARHQRPAVEPWMVPALENELRKDRAYEIRTRVLPVVEGAALRGATLLYDFD